MGQRGEGGTGVVSLAVDVGNTTSSFGLFAASAGETDEPLGTCELTTPQSLTVDEACLQLGSVLELLGGGEGLCGGVAAGALVGGATAGGGVGGAVAVSCAGEAADRTRVASILSCVVPSLSDVWAQALERSLGVRPLVVGPGLRTGMRMAYRDPAEVGPDRIADALAARQSHGSPVVVVDFGTTMNVEVVDASGAFAGGVIAPGLALGARALKQAAARLPQVELEVPSSVIGRSTREAMQAGIVLGEVARVEGLVGRVMGELGCEPPVVLTGTRAEDMARLLGEGPLSGLLSCDQTLTLRGLHQLLLGQAQRRARR